MCQYDFIGTGIYHGRIGHEGVFPRQHFYGQHGEDGLQIAFTSGNDSSSFSKARARQPVVPVWSNQAEAAEGNGAQSLFLYNPLDGSIQPHGFYHVFGACLVGSKRFSCQSGQLLRPPRRPLSVRSIHKCGPMRRLCTRYPRGVWQADNPHCWQRASWTECPLRRCACRKRLRCATKLLCRTKNTLDGLGELSVKNLAFHPAAQPGRYFESGGQ